jgi:hypothetical protein
MNNYLEIWFVFLSLVALGAICSIVFFRRLSSRRKKVNNLDSLLFTVEEKE